MPAHSELRRTLLETVRKGFQQRSNRKFGRYGDHEIPDARTYAIVDLPEGGITELVQKLLELDVPVLAFTDSQSLDGRTRALQAGATEVLSMASSDEEIVGVVNRLISE